MLIDGQLEFAKAQAITASAASTYGVDISIARNIGVGQQLYLVVLCTVAMTDSGSDSTVTPSLRTSATATGTGSGTGGTIALTNTINTLATLPAFAATSAAGTTSIIPLPPATYLRYLDVYFTVANGNLTTGSFSAFIVSDTDLQSFYGIGYTVQ